MGKERRITIDRRILNDQRKNVRFDYKGGDRRSGSGRRSSDEKIEVI